jgi:pSer/pThr/pTyr-binding forkhead associated (FHA) protein
MTALYQLVVRSGPNPGKAYPLDGQQLTVGRDTTCEISINDAEISRKHARFTLQVPGYVLEDLGSTNGSFVNGNRITGPYLVKGGEMIAFGENVVLMCEPLQDPNATMLSASSRAAREAAAAPKQAPAAAPAPAADAPAAAPVFAGHVPPGPEAAPEKPKKKIRPLVIVIIAVVAVVCVCAGALILIDQLSLWCKVLPFLFPGRC